MERSSPPDPSLNQGSLSRVQQASPAVQALSQKGTDSAPSESARKGGAPVSERGDAAIAQWVFEATHASGVPIHPHSQSSSPVQRAPHGSRVEILERDPQKNNWLRVRWFGPTSSSPLGEGWVVERYLKQAGSVRASASEQLSPPAQKTEHSRGQPASSSVWSSREDCERLLSQKKTARAERSSLRVAAYNVRWFPDGKPGRKAPDSGGTDVGWLGCALSALDLDAVAVQEFKTLPRAGEQVRQLIQTLNRWTQGDWRSAFDECPQEATQHVGILWDARRLEAGEIQTLAELNPHGEACKNSLRPGLRVSLRERGGGGGPWFDLLSVHWKSGTDARSWGLRSESFSRLTSYLEASTRPVLVAGDFNTMGCSTCAKASSPREERAQRREALAQKKYSFLPHEEQSCSHYYEGAPNLLDGFVTAGWTRPMQASLAGFCEETSCRVQRMDKNPAVRALSDHCPLVLELE